MKIGDSIKEFNPVLLIAYVYKVVYCTPNYVRLSSGRHYRKIEGVWIEQNPLYPAKLFAITS